MPPANANEPKNKQILIQKNLHSQQCGFGANKSELIFNYLGISDYFGRWPNGIVPIAYNPENAPYMFSDNTKTIGLIQQAMAQWENVCGIKFNFKGITKKDINDDNDNLAVIAWSQLGDTFAGMAGPIFGQSYADYISLGYWPYNDGTLELNSNPDMWFEWGSEKNNNMEFVRVVAHELGHLIGLGHSDNPNSIMFAVETGV